MQLSVVICTYNRSELLRSALGSLSSQTADKDRFEVIVVDNNSTDETKLVALDYCSQQPNWRYLFQSKQGLSPARNMGCGAAQGDYVGYLDDDLTASKEWIATALEIIATHNPHIFGGPSYPYYLSPKPHWFLDAYGSMDYGLKARQLTRSEFLSGKNIVFRRTLIYALGGFDPQLGMSGSQLGFGEETALILKAFDSVPDLNYYYDPRLCVTHLVAPYKMQIRDMARKAFADGRYQYRIFGYPRHGGLSGTIVSAAKLIFWVLTLPLDLGFAFSLRNKKRYRHPENYIYEHSLRILRQIGKSYEQISRLKDRARD
jgi:glucosyl-dolichyl phosphate glucuronosyltransferase